MKETLHIYTRVSSLVQSEDGTSLETQKMDGIRKSVELDFDHVVWNEGGKSSHSSDIETRPVLVDLLSEVEKGNVKHLYVYNTDRLSRNDRTWSIIRWKLKSNDVVVYTNTGRIDLSNPLDDLLMGLLSEISQYDNKIRTERSRRGKFFRVQQGFYQGGPTPYGYKNEKKRLVENPEESQWVRKMYEMYLNGQSVHEIRRLLNEHQVTPRRKKPYWSLGSINKILRNPIYIGWYDYTDKKMGETVRVETPVLVDRITWDSVQTRINKTQERKHQINRSKHFYFLRDFMVCGHCGQKMSGKIGKNNHFYYCPRKERNWVKDDNYEGTWERGRGCSMVRSLNIGRTDQIVWDSILKIVKESKTLREQYRQDFLRNVTKSREKSFSISKKLEKSRKSLKKELHEVEQTITDFETSILLKRHSGDPDQIREKLNRELELVKEKISGVDQEEKNLRDNQRWVNWLDQFENDVDSKKDYSDEEKKEFLMGIVEKIVVHFDTDKNKHSLEIEFNLPIVHDELSYQNPERPIEGWEVLKGNNRIVNELEVSRGGRPSNKR
jgi:DNA invertase Pin-like site-specific DNA recombinase